MAAAVYFLCALTSIACAVLLLRGFSRSKARLLLWSGLCFACLALNNALLFTDKVLLPENEVMMGALSFSTARAIAATLGLGLLVFGLIWDSE